MKAGKTMSIEDYFGIIIWVLMGLAFVAIALIFLYMIYGEKEETPKSASPTKAIKISNSILQITCKIPVFL